MSVSRSARSHPTPLVIPPPASDATARSNPPVPHVLVLDGDAAAGARLARWLHREGCAIALTCSTEEADTILRAARFDLLLVDPDLFGRAGIRWLEPFCARVSRPAVILTPSHLTLQSAARAARLPLAGYLPKPIDHQALAAHLSRFRAT